MRKSKGFTILLMMLRSLHVRYRRYFRSCTIFITLLVWCNVRCAVVASAITIINDQTETAEATDNNNFNVLTREQIESYHNDGYLYVKGGLLPSELVNELAAAVQTAAIIASKRSQASGGYFTVLQAHNIFLPSSTTTALNNHNHNLLYQNQTNHVYRKVVIDSSLPKAVAELMNLNPRNGDNIRYLRDIALVRGVNETNTCGWHVDDIGFWPISYHDTSGINVWMALDDMKHGGTMAVAPKSHTASWRHDAYASLGQNRNKPHGRTQQEVREARSEHTHYLTCDMHLVNETLSNLIESTAVYFDNMERGDIIFSSRLLFHRTLPVTPEGLQYYDKKAKIVNEPQFLNRYSIRYEPGNAEINTGWNVEWSVLHDAKNSGRSLNEIAQLHPELAFYPQVWPTTERIEAMDHVTQYAEAWKEAAKQSVYDTLFSSHSTTTSTIEDATGTGQTCIDEKTIETG